MGSLSQFPLECQKTSQKDLNAAIMCFWKGFGSRASQEPQISDAGSDDSVEVTETAPILPNSSSAPTKIIARRLYVSHFLSTWNSRIFEFGAVLYLASIFPGTLLPMSVYA